MNEHEIMTIEEVISTLKLGAILMYFFIPSIFLVISIYIVRRIKKKQPLKQKSIKTGKKKKKGGKEQLQETVNGAANDSSKIGTKLTLEFNKDGTLKRD